MIDSKYTQAAIIIQRWWRTKCKEYDDYEEEEEHEILTINNNTYAWDLLYSFAQFIYYKIYYYLA